MPRLKPPSSLQLRVKRVPPGTSGPLPLWHIRAREIDDLFNDPIVIFYIGDIQRMLLTMLVIGAFAAFKNPAANAGPMQTALVRNLRGAKVIGGAIAHGLAVTVRGVGRY